MKLIDMAIAILHATKDGDLLAPPELALVEAAANNRLNEEGAAALRELHHNATKVGGYTPPWFHGIEYLTLEHLGFVCWKGRQVEHFDLHDFAYTERGRLAAEKLAERCRILEARGIYITPLNVSWNWPEILESQKPA